MPMKSPEDSSPTSTARSLWMWVVLAFVLLISAWALLIYIASTNKPEVIEVEGLKSKAEGPTALLT